MAFLSMDVDNFSTELSQKTQEPIYKYHCGKAYKDNSGLWRHKNAVAFLVPKIFHKN